MAVPPDEGKDQILDAVKGANPANDIWIYGYDRLRFEKGDGTRVRSMRVAWVWKGLFPQFDGASLVAESDVSEKELSSSRNPRFGDDAAGFERSRFIVQVVDDELK